jgi:tetratricopeptide (TPR) repeat protein
MADPSKLKRKAAEYEQKRQYDRALATYEEVLREVAGREEEADIHLYNRVGDLYLRLGRLDSAIQQYDRAVDLYAEHGFFNNAIALCNKILRHVPGRSPIYYKLGRINARKGFASDAKQNFLEYADRMQKAGQMDEAFRALKEFADISPGQDEIRLMLADQLVRANRQKEALEQLQLVYSQFEAEGRHTEASATIDRIKAIDPSFEPQRSQTVSREKRPDLVFLDLGYETTDLPAGGAQPGHREQPGAPKRRLTPAPHPLTADEFASLDLPSPQAVAPTPIPEHDLALGDLPALEVDTLSSGRTASTPEPLALEPDLGAIDPSLYPREEPGAAADSSLSGIVPENLDADPALENDYPLDSARSPLPTPEEWTANAASASSTSASSPGSATPPQANGEFVDLADWLREDSLSPRPPEAFEDMLAQFKEGVAAHMDEEDAGAHYDLGVAYKEMGLLNEAIAEFQKSVRTPVYKARSYEAIGQAFLEQKKFELAAEALQRALREDDLSDDELVGVLYLLGYSMEALGDRTEAITYYRRVIGVDAKFRDAIARLNALQGRE